MAGKVVDIWTGDIVGGKYGGGRAFEAAAIYPGTAPIPGRTLLNALEDIAEAGGRAAADVSVDPSHRRPPQSQLRDVACFLSSRANKPPRPAALPPRNPT